MSLFVSSDVPMFVCGGRWTCSGGGGRCCRRQAGSCGRRASRRSNDLQAYCDSLVEAINRRKEALTVLLGQIYRDRVDNIGGQLKRRCVTDGDAMQERKTKNGLFISVATVSGSLSANPNAQIRWRRILCGRLTKIFIARLIKGLVSPEAISKKSNMV